MAKSLKLRLNTDDPAGLNCDGDIFQAFAAKYPKEITAYAGIDPTTEHQLDNFGPGSAWMCESPFRFRVDYEDDHTILTIKG